MPLTEYTLVDDPSGLAEALDSLADLSTVGVDVERADWKRYYRSAALVQIGGDGRVLLLDPLTIDDFSPLHRFLEERTALLHALENDLVPLAALGVEPPRVQDTAIAAALIGLPIGLETLLKELLGVESGSDKARMQRADWESRPLDPDMLAYAAGDVADLPALWAELQHRLEVAGRTQWYAEELAAVRAQPSVEERRSWTRTRGIGRLEAEARTRVRALWEARERLAQDTDTAPGRICNDKTLVDLATRPPGSTRELARRGVRRQSVRQFGADLLEALAGAGARPPETPRRDGRRPTEEDRALADRLRSLRAEIAAELGVDAGVLCPSRHLLAALLTDPHEPAALRDALGLRRWQWQAVEQAFCDALEFPNGRTAAEQTAARPAEDARR